MDKPLIMYRARKLNSKEYTKGYLLGMWGNYYLVLGESNSVPNKIEIDSTTLAIATGKFDINDKEIFASIGDIGGDICKWGHGTPRNGGTPTELSDRVLQAKFDLRGLVWGSFNYSNFIYTATEKYLEIISIRN